jgi:hypothetical protein
MTMRLMTMTTPGLSKAKLLDKLTRCWPPTGLRSEML